MELAELTASKAKEALAQAADDDAPQPKAGIDPVLAFSRIARAVRMTVGLHAKIRKDRQARAEKQAAEQAVQDEAAAEALEARRRQGRLRRATTHYIVTTAIEAEEREAPEVERLIEGRRARAPRRPGPEPRRSRLRRHRRQGHGAGHRPIPRRRPRPRLVEGRLAHRRPAETARAAALDLPPLGGDSRRRPAEGGPRSTLLAPNQFHAGSRRAPHGGLAPACSPQRGEIIGVRPRPCFSAVRRIRSLRNPSSERPANSVWLGGAHEDRLRPHPPAPAGGVRLRRAGGHGACSSATMVAVPLGPRRLRGRGGRPARAARATTGR